MADVEKPGVDSRDEGKHRDICQSVQSPLTRLTRPFLAPSGRALRSSDAFDYQITSGNCFYFCR